MQSLNIVFTGKSNVELRRESVAELKDGQVLIETQQTLISTGTELTALEQNFGKNTHWDRWVKYPFNPGYSNAGRVLRVADNVSNIQVGDRVATHGPHHQYIVVDAEHVHKIPDAVSDEDATWFSLGNAVQIGVRRAEHGVGDVVVVIGQGLLGQLVVQYARLCGAREIIAVDVERRRLEMASAHGATHSLEMGAEEAFEAVADITEGKLADVVYDVTGNASVFAHALRLPRRFGKLILQGDPGTPSDQRLTSDVITRGIRIIGAHNDYTPTIATEHAYWTHANMARLFFTYLERGQISVQNLVTHRYSPEEALQAYDMLVTNRAAAMGVIFDWSRLGKSGHP